MCTRRSRVRVYFFVFFFLSSLFVCTQKFGIMIIWPYLSDPVFIFHLTYYFYFFFLVLVVVVVVVVAACSRFIEYIRRAFVQVHKCTLFTSFFLFDF